MQETANRLLKDDHYHAEDLVMKTAARFFGEELIVWIGEKRKPLRIAPTEIIRLESRQLYQDFTYEMSEKLWYHFEFESDRISTEDLKRFREYEAATSRTYGVDVVTFVICSAKMKKIRNQLKTGINTYSVNVIPLKGKNADKIFRKLETVHQLKRKDLIDVLLSPLMSGKMSIQDRIMRALHLFRNAEEIFTKEEITKMEAMLYALANKLLDPADLEKVKEELAMTRLGKMLLEDGIKQGIKQGVKQGICIGEEQGRLQALRSLMTTMKMTVEQAMDALQIPAQDREKVRELMKKQGAGL